MNTTIPSVEVGREFLSDPETEHMIWGDELVDGMVVLIGDGSMRGGIFSTASRSLETQRWCRVSRLRKRDQVVSFIGQYADGSEMVRSYNQAWSWYVRNEATS